MKDLMMTNSLDIKLNDVKNELKGIGCKIKSQLDGSWAILEPKGARTIVQTLEEAHDYVLTKTCGSSSQPSSILAAIDVESPNLTATPPVKTKAPQQQMTSARPELTAEQQKAKDAVSTVLKDLMESRLSNGLNFLHSELSSLLSRHGCPESMKEKALAYAESKISKDRQSKSIVGIVIRHPSGQKDVMYFDSHFAQFLKSG